MITKESGNGLVPSLVSRPLRVYRETVGGLEPNARWARLVTITFDYALKATGARLLGAIPINPRFCITAALHPGISLKMHISAQRKVGRKKKARRRFAFRFSPPWCFALVSSRPRFRSFKGEEPVEEEWDSYNWRVYATISCIRKDSLTRPMCSLCYGI